MVILAEYSRTATFAWSQDNIPKLVTGTAAGTVDANFSNESTLELWSLLSPTPDKPTAFLKTDAKFKDLDWSHDNKFIAGAFDNGVIEIFRTTGEDDSNINLESVTKISKHSSSVNTLDFNGKQHNLLLSGGAQKGEIFIWDLNKCTNGKSEAVPVSPGTAITSIDEVTSVAWNKSLAHVFASAGATNFASIWDLKAKKEVIHLSYMSPTTGLKPQLSVVEWHPTNSTQVATASGSDNEPIILIWDLRNSNTPLQTLANGHSKGILSLDWCAQDESLFLSSSRDNTVMLWNPISGTQLTQYPTRSNWCFKAAFAPHAPEIFASASFDTKIEVQTLQDIVNTLDSEVEQQKKQESETDFWNNISVEKPREKPIVMNMQAPAWYGNKSAAAKWGFGGKLVQIAADGRSVNVTRPTIPGMQVIDELLGEALKTKDFKPLINYRMVKGLDKVDEDDWGLLERLSMDGKDTVLKELIAFESADSEESGLDESKGSEKNDGETFFSLIENKFKPEGAFKLKEGPERAIARDLINKNPERAINKALKQNLLMDALVIALDTQDNNLKALVKEVYFKNYAPKSSLSRLIYSVTGDDLTDMIENLDITQWKYVARAITKSNAASDESKRNELLVSLGDRLAAKGMRQEALYLYLLGNSLEKVASIWMREFNNLEDRLTGKNMTVYEAHAECLTEFIEKFTVLASYFADSGKLTIHNEELVSKFLEFVTMASGSGNLDLAAAFLDNLPADDVAVMTERERVMIASGKRSTTASAAASAAAGRGASKRIPPNAGSMFTTNISGSPTSKHQQRYKNAALPPFYGAKPTPQMGMPPQQVPFGNQQLPNVPPTMGPTVTSQRPNPYVVDAGHQSSGGSQANKYAPTRKPSVPTTKRSSFSGAGASSYIPPANPYAVPPPPMGAQVGGFLGGSVEPTAPKPSGQIQSPTLSGQTPGLNKKANDGWNDLPLKVSEEKVSRAKAVSVAPSSRSISPGRITASPLLKGAAPPPPPLTKSRKATPITPANDYPHTLQRPTSPYAPKLSDFVPVTTAPPPASPYAVEPNGPPSQASMMGAGTAPSVPPAAKYHNPYAPPPVAPEAPVGTRAMNPYAVPEAIQNQPPVRTAGSIPVGPPPTSSRRKSQRAVGNVPTTSILDSMQNALPTAERGVPGRATPTPARAPAGGIPEDQKPIVEFLKAELERVTPLTPKEYTKQLKDCEKRLKILFDHLEKQDLLTQPTIEKLKELVTCLKEKKYSEAMQIHVDIATNHAAEGGNWLTGVKRLIGISEATSSQ